MTSWQMSSFHPKLCSYLLFQCNQWILASVLSYLTFYALHLGYDCRLYSQLQILKCASSLVSYHTIVGMEFGQTSMLLTSFDYIDRLQLQLLLPNKHCWDQHKRALILQLLLTFDLVSLRLHFAEVSKELLILTEFHTASNNTWPHLINIHHLHQLIMLWPSCLILSLQQFWIL